MKILLFVFALLVSVDAGAKLLVGKNYVSKYTVALQQTVFEYEIINKGDGDAINVELDDSASFPTDRFQILRGSTHVKFARIPSGSSVLHHIVVVPLKPQPNDAKDVVVVYKDEKSGILYKSSAVSAERRQHDFFYPEKSMIRLTGVRSEHFLGFAAIALPMTVLTAVFYQLSAQRYSSIIPKKKK